MPKFQRWRCSCGSFGQWHATLRGYGSLQSDHRARHRRRGEPGPWEEWMEEREFTSQAEARQFSAIELTRSPSEARRGSVGNNPVARLLRLGYPVRVRVVKPWKGGRGRIHLPQVFAGRQVLINGNLGVAELRSVTSKRGWVTLRQPPGDVVSVQLLEVEGRVLDEKGVVVAVP